MFSIEPTFDLTSADLGVAGVRGVVVVLVGDLAAAAGVVLLDPASTLGVALTSLFSIGVLALPVLVSIPGFFAGDLVSKEAVPFVSFVGDDLGLAAEVVSVLVVALVTVLVVLVVVVAAAVVELALTVVAVADCGLGVR